MAATNVVRMNYTVTCVPTFDHAADRGAGELVRQKHGDF